MKPFVKVRLPPRENISRRIRTRAAPYTGLPCRAGCVPRVRDRRESGARVGSPDHAAKIREHAVEI